MKSLLGLLALFIAVPAAAQMPDTVSAMMRRIFASAEFAPQRFGPARWIDNGAAYTTVENSEIVRYETATGSRSILVSARQLVPAGASEALDFDDYAWSSDGNLLLLFTNTARVAAEYARRLLGAGSQERRAEETRRGERPAVHDDVRQVLAERRSRRLRT